MIDSNYKPLLRSEIEILPARDEKQDANFILIRDKEGLTDKSLIMPFEMLIIIGMFDGNTSIKDIQTEIMKETKTLLPESELIHIVKELDDAYFLENERSKELREKIISEFKNSNVRKPIHSGLSYPKEILELTSFMSKFYRIEKITPISPVTGAISPHIDFHRGGRVYAATYAKLNNSIKPEVIIAFGTSHRGGNSPFILTPKKYETPYGLIEVDKEIYDKFKEILWYDPDAEEYYHKNEHSLEFQAVWLKYIWREETPKWIPILTSNFERFASDSPPSKIETVEKLFKETENFIKELAKNKKVLILAGADLSHVGPRFGDPIEITPQLKSEIEKKDKEKIDKILNLDPDGFYMSVMSEKNATNICGLSAIYSALRMIKALNPNSKPELLDYSQADDPFGGFVSFASIVF
ncbi:MAG: AmmeMemoRadiSam system protein B [Elusimicrobiota bacterium]